MNKLRRKEIDTIISKLEELQGDIEQLHSEEEEYCENMPENLQDSERHQAAEDAMNELEYAKDSFDEIFDHLNNARDGQ